MKSQGTSEILRWPIAFLVYLIVNELQYILGLPFWGLMVLFGASIFLLTVSEHFLDKKYEKMI